MFTSKTASTHDSQSVVARARRRRVAVEDFRVRSIQAVDGVAGRPAGYVGRVGALAVALGVPSHWNIRPEHCR